MNMYYKFWATRVYHIEKRTCSPLYMAYLYNLSGLCISLGPVINCMPKVRINTCQSISLLVNLHVGHLIGHLVNLHDQHHNLSNTTSISIINYQSLVSKVLSRYLHSPGSHQSTRFLEWLTQWLTLSLLERLVTLKRHVGQQSLLSWFICNYSLDLFAAIGIRHNVHNGRSKLLASNSRIRRWALTAEEEPEGKPN